MYMEGQQHWLISLVIMDPNPLLLSLPTLPMRGGLSLPGKDHAEPAERPTQKDFFLQAPCQIENTKAAHLRLSLAWWVQVEIGWWA